MKKREAQQRGERRREGGHGSQVSSYSLMYDNGINRDSNYETSDLSLFSVSAMLPGATVGDGIEKFLITSPARDTVMNLYRGHYTASLCSPTVP